MDQLGTVIALNVSRKNEQIYVGIASLSRKLRNSVNCDPSDKLWVLESLDFMDNDQLSNVDTMLVRIGRCKVYVTDGVDNYLTNKVYKNLLAILVDRDCDIFKVKQNLFCKSKSDIESSLLKLIGHVSQSINAAENEHPIAYGCLGCLITSLGLLSRSLDDEEALGLYDLKIGSLNSFMRLDSSACDAINLIPRSDDPSKFGSIYGMLNHCKTKLGSRLLMR